jgi:hypothetical protein
VNYPGSSPLFFPPLHEQRLAIGDAALCISISRENKPTRFIGGSLMDAFATRRDGGRRPWT